jgi:hypothetical protein
MSDRYDPGDPAGDASPPAWDATPPEPPKPWWRRRLAPILAGAAVVLAYPLAKIAIGFFAVSVIGGAVSGAFGNQWERLPSDVRDDLTAQMQDAYGDSLDNLSNEEASATMEADVRHGMLRLDDETLIHRLQLQTSAVNKLALADCAGFARSSLAGERASDELVNSIQEALDATEYQAWIKIAVQAAVAERSGSPEVRTVSDADQNAAINTWLSSLSQSELAGLQAVVADPSRSDEEFCTVAKAVYNRAITSDHDLLAMIAYIDVAQAP